MNWYIPIIIAALYVVLAPVLGMLMAGIDRKISARMQSRKGPPVLQPYYDVRKLMEKESRSVNWIQGFYIGCFLLFTVITGALFFAGRDLLLIIFALTLAGTFLILAAYSSNSPYSQVGAAREAYMMMAYEPMVLLTAIGLYLVCGSYNVADIFAGGGEMPIKYLAGVFIGFLFILTIKFRKSPFDLSMSHHAHQDIVRGVTTEFSGRTLAAVEVAHWYENVMLLGLVFLFFCDGTTLGYAIGAIAAVLVFLLETFIDNSFARTKRETMMKSAWAVTAVLGVLNILVLFIIN